MVEIFSRERAIFYTFPLQDIFFFKYSSSSRNFLNISPLQKLPKHLYLQYSYHLNQNFCYSSNWGWHCVKNLTYVWYLINLCQKPSLFIVLNKISTHSYSPDLLFILFCPLFFLNINNFPYKTLNFPYLYLNSPYNRHFYNISYLFNKVTGM